MIIIGIAGASGSGKTTLASKLVQHFGNDNCLLISCDSYYKDLKDVPPEELMKQNFDHPDAIDIELLSKDIQTLSQEKPINLLLYDYNTCRRTIGPRIYPKKFIIIEGILILHFDELSNLFNFKLYVETDMDLCLIRRLNRDITERARTIDHKTLEKYENIVRPMFKTFVEPSKKHADYIVKNTTDIDMNTVISLFTNCNEPKSTHHVSQSNFLSNTNSLDQTGKKLTILQENKTGGTMDTLPTDVLLNILSKCTIQSLLSVKNTNKQFRYLTQNAICKKYEINDSLEPLSSFTGNQLVDATKKNPKLVYVLPFYEFSSKLDSKNLLTIAEINEETFNFVINTKQLFKIIQKKEIILLIKNHIDEAYKIIDACIDHGLEQTDIDEIIAAKNDIIHLPPYFEGCLDNDPYKF